MSYNPITDFLGLLRSANGGVRTERMPGLDFVVAALARAGLFTVSVSVTAPTVNQAITVWVKPYAPSWLGECSVYLWNASTNQYEPATPALWSALLAPSSSSGIVQDVNAAGPVNVAVNARVVRVQNVGAPVSLIMPLSANKVGSVLITDWANHAGTNPITVTLSGGELFPLGNASWVIGADAGSIELRTVSGGYAI